MEGWYVEAGWKEGVGWCGSMERDEADCWEDEVGWKDAAKRFDSSIVSIPNKRRRSAKESLLADRWFLEEFK